MYLPPRIYDEEHLVRRSQLCGGHDWVIKCPEGWMELTSHGDIWTVVFNFNHGYGRKEIHRGQLYEALRKISEVVEGGTPFLPVHLPGAPTCWTHFEYDNSYRAVFHEGEFRIRTFKGGWLLVYVTADQAFVPVAWGREPREFTATIEYVLSDIHKKLRRVAVLHDGNFFYFQMSDHPGEIARCRLDHETVVTLGEHDVEFKDELAIPRLAVKIFGCAETIDVLGINEERAIMSPIGASTPVNYKQIPHSNVRTTAGRARHQGREDGVQPQPQDVLTPLNPSIKEAFVNHLNEVATIGGPGRAIRKKLVSVFSRLADVGNPYRGRGKVLQEQLAKLSGGKLGCDRAFRYAMTTFLEHSCLIRHDGDDLVMDFPDLRDPTSALYRSLAPWLPGNPESNTPPVPSAPPSGDATPPGNPESDTPPVPSAPPSGDATPDSPRSAPSSQSPPQSTQRDVAHGRESPTVPPPDKKKANHDDYFQQFRDAHEEARAASARVPPRQRIPFKPRYKGTDPHDDDIVDDFVQPARAPPQGKKEPDT
jgi:hypothetical protein